jgi:hypothetical protein
MKKYLGAMASVIALWGTNALADGPAVSETNGKISVEAGGVGGRRPSAIGITQGSLTAPLGTNFGVQVDGAGTIVSDSFFGGGAAHLFWRDPQIGLAGPIVAVAGGRGTRLGWYGGEADFYAGVVTIGAIGGYQDATSPANIVPSGGFFGGHLTVYPIPDLAITGGYDQTVGVGMASGRVEYQPDFLVRRNVSLFANAANGPNGFYQVTGGVRFFFGPEKSLIRRHREDDPKGIILPPVITIPPPSCIQYDPNQACQFSP